MPNLVTLTLEDKFKSFATSMNWIMNEALNIDKSYFSTDASTLVGALPSGTSGASLDTKLTKSQYQNGIGFVEQLNNFFSNSAVTTGDYLTNIEQLIYGNAASPTLLSAATESLANRMVTLASSALTQFNIAKDILNAYNNSGLGVLVSGGSGSTIVYGANHNITQLTQGITLVEQFKKLVNNESVATGLYSANVAIWQMI